MDWNDDGVGDLPGLVQRIDHLADLGVTCLWLMPFYPTADYDDGYDISDFYGVDPRLGDAGDLVEVIRTAKDRGIRVIVDLVVNHTSEKHPWFQSARKSKDSPFRDFYVWRSDKPPSTKDKVVFPDKETGIWTKDDATGEWYRHTFYHQQPDLNTANPQVRDAIAKVIGYWAELGLSGFRVDAVPFFLADAAKTPGDNVEDKHDFLKELRAFLTRRVGDAILMGEVNLPYAEQQQYFGGDGGRQRRADPAVRLHRDAEPVPGARPAGRAARSRRPWTRRPEIPHDAQWATFVRNHDELTLDKLSDDEKPGGVRRLRPRPRHAAVRPRPAPTPPDDARRRPAPHPDGLLAAVLAARHARAVLRRGDRHGREPGGRGTDGGPHADAVDVGRQRRLLAGVEARAVRPGHRGRVRPRARQRRRPASRPRLAPDLRAAAGPALPRVPRARLDAARRDPRPAAPRRPRAPQHLGRRVD